MSWQIQTRPDGFSLSCNGVELLHHSTGRPMISLARTSFDYRSHNGQHTIKNQPVDWTPLAGFTLSGEQVHFFAGEISLTINLKQQADGIAFTLDLPEGFNYARVRLPASPGEAVYGGGIQFSHLNLRGRRFPIWTSEAGVGRDRFHITTLLADVIAGAGGNYWTTYYPAPVFISTRGAGYVLQSDRYSMLDFRERDEHGIEFMGSAHMQCFAAKGLKDLLGGLVKRAGIQPAPPDWVFEGGILGIQGGVPFVGEIVDRLVDAGAALTGIWTQDWQGTRMTPTGKRLFWNWQVDDELYPCLEGEIQKLGRQNIRWLGYLNPYFNAEGEQFETARQHEYLVKDVSGGVIIRLISEFAIGMLDLTNPEACLWYKGLIKKNLLGLGLRGWMADYGEDVSSAQCFAYGGAGQDVHNLYPRLWAQVNREVVEEAGVQDDVLVFHRSGAFGQNRYSNSQWAGDQLVGWDEHDGFPSAVTGGLGACMSGIQYYHSDAGGYTTLGWYKRSRELLARWSEANAFSPVLRTHEGNRPWENAQPWTDEQTVRDFVRATRLHAALAPYLKHVSAEAQRTGLGMMRPFCLSNPGARWRNKKDAWYLGEDLLVFPVLKQGIARMRVDIPEGEWIHMFSGKKVHAGSHVVGCPIGQPPVFWRQRSGFEPLFEGMREIGIN
jgi:alpha-glucosidase